jgi:hypothetical protein
MIAAGGGISLDGTRWVRCKPGFLLPVRVLSRLFRRLFRAALVHAHAAGGPAFFGEIEGLRRREAFAAYLAPLMRKNWFAYASRSSLDPKQCSPISPATPIASPSRTVASLLSTSAA